MVNLSIEEIVLFATLAVTIAGAWISMKVNTAETMTELRLLKEARREDRELRANDNLKHDEHYRNLYTKIDDMQRTITKLDLKFTEQILNQKNGG